MKVKKSKKITHQLRHAPLSTEMERPVGKLRVPKVNSSKNDRDDDDIIIGDNDDDNTYDQEDHKIQKKIGKDVNEFNGADRILSHQNNSSKQQWMNENDSDDDEVIYIYMIIK